MTATLGHLCPVLSLRTCLFTCVHSDHTASQSATRTRDRVCTNMLCGCSKPRLREQLCCSVRYHLLRKDNFAPLRNSFQNKQAYHPNNYSNSTDRILGRRLPQPSNDLMAVAGPRSQYMLLSKFQRPLQQDEICDMSQWESDLRNHGINGEYIPLFPIFPRSRALKLER